VTVQEQGVRHSVRGERGANLKQGLATLLKGGDYDYVRPRRGEVRKATILSIGENDVVVDLGTWIWSTMKSTWQAWRLAIVSRSSH
jgi:hypothetical protein